MQLTETVAWDECQVLNLRVVTGAKQAAVVQFEVPLTPDIAKTLGCEAVYLPNNTARSFFRTIALDVGKMKDVSLNADGCDLVAKLATGWNLKHTEDGLMLRFSAKFTEGHFEIVAGFVQDRKDDPFLLKITPAFPDSRDTSEDHAASKPAASVVQ